MSDRRTLANRTNASKSTGPKTEHGKAIAGSNSTRHGIFSDCLFLDDEEPADYDRLQLDLHSALAPVGTLELSLVERIAVNMWRQRRLVAAETASLTLAREQPMIARAVGSELCGSYITDRIGTEDLKPFDTEREQWCRAILTEIDNLEEFEFSHIEANAPLLYAQLKSDAEEDHEELPAYFDNYPNGSGAYIIELQTWCQKQIAAAEERPKLLALADEIKAKRLVLPEDALNLFTRYQTTLDNQIYKALKALREAQEWRLKTLDAKVEAVGMADEPAE